MEIEEGVMAPADNTLRVLHNSSDEIIPSLKGSYDMFTSVDV